MTLICTVCLASKNNTNKNTKIAFHKLPKKPLLRSMWLRSLNMTEETVSKFKDFRVCSRHFKNEEYVEKNDNFWHLKPGVVPSMRLPQKINYVLPEASMKPVKNVPAPPPQNTQRFMVQNVSGQTLPSEQVPLPVLSLIQKLATEGVGFPMIIQQEPNTQVTAGNQPNSTTLVTTAKKDSPKPSTASVQHSNSEVVFKNVQKLISSAVENSLASLSSAQKEGTENTTEQPNISQETQLVPNNPSAISPIIAKRKIKNLGQRDFKDALTAARTNLFIKTQLGRQRANLQKAQENNVILNERLIDLRNRLKMAKLRRFNIDEDGDVDMKD